MALAECRRFPLLPQALVARATLEAAGLHPFVFDEYRAAMVWTEQFAIGGIRLMVPEQELEPATQILLDIESRARSAAPTIPSPARPAYLLMLFLLSVSVGWPIAGFRLRDRFHRVTALVVTVLLVSAYILLWLNSAFRGN